MNKPVIGFAGLTHLGLNSAAASASNKFTTIGYHDSSSYVASINRGILPIIEPGLDQLIKKSATYLTFSCDLNILSKCDIIYISADVPTYKNGKSNLSPIKKIIRSCESVIKSTAILVILCQVPPGFTRQISYSHKSLYYQVETLIFGEAVVRATSPERIILGCADPKNRIDQRLLKFLNTFNCPILTMQYESAELAKISINICLVASISAANTMSEICEKAGANWSEIAPALKLDKRIGKNSYLKPGLGIAGGNLERDLHTAMELCNKYSTNGGVIKAWINHSNYRKDWAWRILNEKILNRLKKPKIGILGLAYKKNTHSTKNSASLQLINRLSGISVSVHDPAVSQEDIDLPVLVSTNIEEVAKNADAIVIMTPWEEYKNINLNILSSNMRGRILVDPYAVLNEEKVKNVGLEYITLGC